MLGHHKTTLFYVTEVTNDTTCYSNVQCYGLAHFIGRGEQMGNDLFKPMRYLLVPPTNTSYRNLFGI